MSSKGTIWGMSRQARVPFIDFYFQVVCLYIVNFCRSRIMIKRQTCRLVRNQRWVGHFATAVRLVLPLCQSISNSDAWLTGFAQRIAIGRNSIVMLVVQTNATICEFIQDTMGDIHWRHWKDRLCDLPILWRKKVSTFDWYVLANIGFCSITVGWSSG